MSWRDASVVRRLVGLTLLAGLLTGLLGMALVGWLQIRSLRADAADRNAAVAQRTAAAIDGRIDAVRSQLELLASVPHVSELGRHAEDELTIALRVSDELDQLVLHDRDGDVVAAVASSRLLSPADVPRREAQGVAGAAVLVTGERFPVVELAVPVEDPPGTVAGVLVGRLPLSLLTPEVEGGLLTNGRTAHVVDGQGRIVAHRELDRVLAGERYPVAQALAEGRSVATDGPAEPVLVAGAQLSSLPAWILIEQPERVAVARAEAAAGGVTAVLLAVVAVVVAVVVIAGRRLLRPLRGLVDAVGRLEQGEREVRVETGGAADVNALAGAFNRMASSLDERRAALEAAELAARRSEERLRLLLEGVEDYAIVLLDRDGSIRSWNTGARRLLGYEADGAVGRPFREVFAAGEDVRRADPVLEASVSGRGDTEGWCERADGSRFWARTVVTALADDDGHAYGYAVVVHDLTERQAARVALEEALAREHEAADELRRANELKDEFLAIATHEIRTPLSAILGASNLLSSGWHDLDEADRVRFRDMIGAHARDMHLIVDRLLDFTRLQAGRVQLLVESFDLAGEIDRSLGLLAGQLRGHELHVEAPARTVRLDRGVLRHVVTNLVSNAAKFSPPGSPIHLTARIEDGGRLTLVVRDQGSGIPPEDHEAVFELFRQSHNPYSTARGTGVGLAIVKRYVELAGGEVSLDSAPGRGSTFTVRLPLDPIGTPTPMSGTLGP